MKSRASELIDMHHKANEQDAKNRQVIGETMHTLSKIDKNLNRADQLLGRSNTHGRLPTVKKKKQ